MTKKQMADVFIKVLGLYFCVDGVVRGLTGIFNIFASLFSRYGGISSYTWVTVFTGLVLGGIGVLLMVLSRSMADALFKDE